MVTVSKDGPYIITGGIDLIGDNWDKTKDSRSHEFTKFIDSFDTS
jgi:hypothetical protein